MIGLRPASPKGGEGGPQKHAKTLCFCTENERFIIKNIGFLHVFHLVLTPFSEVSSPDFARQSQTN